MSGPFSASLSLLSLSPLLSSHFSLFWPILRPLLWPHLHPLLCLPSRRDSSIVRGREKCSLVEADATHELAQRVDKPHVLWLDGDAAAVDGAVVGH